MFWDAVGFVTGLGKGSFVRRHIFFSSSEDALCVVWLMKTVNVSALGAAEARRAFLLGEPLWKRDKKYGGWERVRGAGVSEDGVKKGGKRH